MRGRADKRRVVAARRRGLGEGARVGVDGGVAVWLTAGQVREVLWEVTGAGGLAGALSGVGELEWVRGVVEPMLADPGYSQALLRALLVLAVFPADGSERELTEVAKELGLSPATTHRYLYSWAGVGLLAQDPRSRRYRRVVADGVSETIGGGHGG